jgi:hypothetical protein
LLVSASWVAAGIAEAPSSRPRASCRGPGRSRAGVSRSSPRRVRRPPLTASTRRTSAGSQRCARGRDHLGRGAADVGEAQAAQEPVELWGQRRRCGGLDAHRPASIRSACAARRSRSTASTRPSRDPARRARALRGCGARLATARRLVLASGDHARRRRPRALRRRSPRALGGSAGYGTPLFRGGRPAWNPGIFAGERRRPAASSSSSVMTPPRARDTSSELCRASPCMRSSRRHASATAPSSNEQLVAGDSSREYRLRATGARRPKRA